MSKHVNLYDFMTFAPDTLAAGNEAFGVYCRMLTYACLHDEDGDVDRQAFVLIAGEDRAEFVERSLTAAHLVIRTGRGLKIVDFDTVLDEEDDGR